MLQAIEAGDLQPIISSIIEYENSRNPYPERKEWVVRCLTLATERRRLDHGIIGRARTLERAGLPALDALHLASAEAAKADVLLTCDDRLIAKYRGEMRVLTPVDFVVSVMGVQPWP